MKIVKLALARTKSYLSKPKTSHTDKIQLIDCMPAVISDPSSLFSQNLEM